MAARMLAHDQDALVEGPTINVNSELGRRAVVQTAAVPWSPSPWIPGINRKFLDRYGNGQFVPSTSVVSFASGVRDPYHAHPHGEEFYVLSGVFTDHTGDYLPGFYVRHPMRWCHAPYVDPQNDDAVLWVKVSQVAEEGEPIIVEDTCDLDLSEWEDAPSTSGRIRRRPLHTSQRTGERVWIELWEPGTENLVTQPAGGEEVFVISGSLLENGVAHPALTWIRNPPDGEGKCWARSAPEGCKLLMKSGHLPMVSKLYEQAKDGSLFSSSVLQYREGERIHGSAHGVDVRRRKRELETPPR
ncbi:cupin domain-containing protein [Archangium lansingense]|uniref:Cupin domain-containing protein n=1 Tax=Archangium lansingense TaxID=2995310 RepID=A0ABT4A9A7_9BACT|nr:cupin domain-containing protein [Archangium lansinium]MCY1078176.1 cupin domain-containing protein [Archangium lansinium]